MKIHFYATLRQIAGQKTIEFDLPDGVTLGQVLAAILERFPPMARELVDENGMLYPHVHMFINGRDAPYLTDHMDTILKSTDKVDVFPAVGGGGR